MTLYFSSAHAPHPWFSTEDNELLIGGKKVSVLAAEVGQTPFYAYDRQIINEKIQELRNILPKQIKLNYAIKANPMPALVAHIASQVDGMDVASASEIHTALKAGASPDQISFSGPGKTTQELQLALDTGIIVHVESEREIRLLSELAQQTGYRPKIAIRINPDFELKSSGMKMGGGPKPFGIDAERIPQILQHLPYDKLQFCGFHIYSGSQNLRPDFIMESQIKSLELAARLSSFSAVPITHLNIGGGFGIPYFPGEKPLVLTDLATHFDQLVVRTQQLLPAAQLVIELGRFLVGEAGVYVCKVLDKKVSRGSIFLVTDGGMHHHLAASGNLGQVIRKNYPVHIANRISNPHTEMVSIVGPLCTPLDLLADRVNLAEAQEGDWIAIFQSGAYGLTASPIKFLSHPEPKEVLV